MLHTHPDETTIQFTLHSGEPITVIADEQGVELTGPIEPDGLHLTLSWGDTAELSLLLSRLLGVRLFGMDGQAQKATFRTSGDHVGNKRSYTTERTG